MARRRLHSRRSRRRNRGRSRSRSSFPRRSLKSSIKGLPSTARFNMKFKSGVSHYYKRTGAGYTHYHVKGGKVIKSYSNDSL